LKANNEYMEICTMAHIGVAPASVELSNWREHPFVSCFLISDTVKESLER